MPSIILDRKHYIANASIDCVYLNGDRFEKRMILLLIHIEPDPPKRIIFFVGPEAERRVVSV